MNTRPPTFWDGALCSHRIAGPAGPVRPPAWKRWPRYAKLLAVATNPPAQASAEFKLSITRALADQLADALSRLHPAPLTSERLSVLQQRPGVYELFWRGERAYVGKASASVPARLGNHLRKLSGRMDIVLSDMTFQCLYVDEDLDAAAPEKMLIKKYRDQRDHDGAPWNTNGFGNKDPGRNRDHSLVKANHFDAEHPINLCVRVESVAPGSYPVRTFLRAVKAGLPFNLRFDTRSAHARQDYSDSRIQVASGELTARDLIRLAIGALPEGWQATALPGYVIFYHEDETYASARVMWRKRDGAVSEITGAARLDEPGAISEEEAGDDE